VKHPAARVAVVRKYPQRNCLHLASQLFHQNSPTWSGSLRESVLVTLRMFRSDDHEAVLRYSSPAPRQNHTPRPHLLLASATVVAEASTPSAGPRPQDHYQPLTRPAATLPQPRSRVVPVTCRARAQLYHQTQWVRQILGLGSVVRTHLLQTPRAGHATGGPRQGPVGRDHPEERLSISKAYERCCRVLGCVLLVGAPVCWVASRLARLVPVVAEGIAATTERFARWQRAH